jgi:molecular chaperone GrpE
VKGSGKGSEKGASGGRSVTTSTGRRKGKKSQRPSERAANNGAFNEVLKMSSEIESEIATIDGGKFGDLDAYSASERVLIFQSELIDRINKVVELEESLLRMAADFDNYRKRTERERERTIKFANQGLILKLLEVLDNLDRAVETDCTDPEKNGESFVEGIKLIQSQFRKVLADEGVQAIDETGVAFDPYKHEAMMHIVDSDQEENTVTDVFLKGYYLRDRVIRAAQVRISKKGE